MTEAELQAAVIELAKVYGWTVAHFRPAQTSKGWRTPVAADGKGFPDLVLVHPHPMWGGVLFRELKSQRGKLAPEQERWGTTLTEAGGDWAVWRPSDWDRIVKRLSFGRATQGAS